MIENQFDSLLHMSKTVWQSILTYTSCASTDILDLASQADQQINVLQNMSRQARRQNLA